mgnify:CR=1 FL=1
MSEVVCPGCGGPIPPNEAAAYGDRCEDCYGAAMAGVFEERNIRPTMIPKTLLGGPRSLAQQLAAAKVSQVDMAEHAKQK